MRQNLANIDYMGMNNIMGSGQAQRGVTINKYRPKVYTDPQDEEDLSQTYEYRKSTEVKQRRKHKRLLSL
jgi:hypothetical protein